MILLSELVLWCSILVLTHCPFTSFFFFFFFLYLHTDASVSESPWRLRPVSAVMGGQGGAQDVTRSKFEKGIKKIRWNQLLLLTPIAPHDKTLTSNHSDHHRGVRLKLVPSFGRYGSPGVTEALTLLKSLYCFKNGMKALPKNRCVSCFSSDFLELTWYRFLSLFFFQVSFPSLTYLGRHLEADWTC